MCSAPSAPATTAGSPGSLSPTTPPATSSGKRHHHREYVRHFRHPRHNVFGIYASLGTGLVISGNTLGAFSGTNACIQIGDAGLGVTDFTVTGNQVVNTASTIKGMLIEDSTLGAVSGNMFYGALGAGSVGIALLSSTTAVIGIAVPGNRIFNYALGIGESGSPTPDYNSYVGNNLHGCTASSPHRHPRSFSGRGRPAEHRRLMTFAAVGTWISARGTGSGTTTTMSVTPANIGDFYISPSGDSTSAASTRPGWPAAGTTWTMIGAHEYSAFTYNGLWIGKITATGASTITVTWSAAVTGATLGITTQEFDSTAGT